MRKKGATLTVKKVDEAEREDFFNYNRVCIGAPSYEFLPPLPMMDFLKRKLTLYRKKGYIKPCAPKVPGKNAIIFCTYSGPHTGIDEVTTAGKYMRQVFGHLGFDVKAEWYVMGEFHGSEELGTKGRLGDIRGRPNDAGLAKIENGTAKLISSLMS